MLRKHLCISIVSALCLMAWASASYAQFSDIVSIHGFGGWAYGRTDNDNRYLVGNKDGSYDHFNLSLNFSATPYENLSFYVQTGFNEMHDGNEAVLDYAFADWSYSDAFAVRIGKVKAPIMLYTEVYDVGTIRPFFLLPQGVYRDLAAEAYKGIGITGSLYTIKGWEFVYDLFGGNLGLHPNQEFDLQSMGFVTTKAVAQNMLAGRLTITTPFDGLTASASAYTGEVQFYVNDTYIPDHPLADNYGLLGSGLEYLGERLTIRTEYVQGISNDLIDLNTAYVEAAYHLTEHWQAAVRYETDDITIKQPLLAADLEHRDLAAGINYWFNPNFVIKGSWHHVTGNRFAQPDNLSDYITAISGSGFEETTNLYLLGAQFSF